MKRWTELHGAIASASARTEAETDLFCVRNKRRKAKRFISLVVCSMERDGYSVPLCEG